MCVLCDGKGVEEYLDDFPAESKEKRPNLWLQHNRAESTDPYAVGSGITTKIPPLFGGSTSWFKYDE